MKPVTKIALVLACSAALAVPATAQRHDPRPPANYQGQWWTSPGGCSYSRAGGYGGKAPTWHLILNPYHIGQAPARKDCAAWL